MHFVRERRWPAGGGQHRPLVAHIIHHLGVGGLENGLVNLVNHMPASRYRHTIVCLKGTSDFSRRIARKDVEVIPLNKREGHDIGLYFRLYKTLRHLQPDIVHTRNLAALEAQIVAKLARIPARVHGEHGRGMLDLHGQNPKYKLMRKAVRPFVPHFIAVSKDLEHWLLDTISVRRSCLSQIYNGVDEQRFFPRCGPRDAAPAGFLQEDSIVIGSVGRMVAIKDFLTLVKSFLLLLGRVDGARTRLRLMIVGDGETRRECEHFLREANASHLAWFSGERTDIPDLMRLMDIFVLPSLGEGISNTILEAMATGLPVVASRVGGNSELVQDGVTGTLVAPGAPEQLAAILSQYCTDAELRARRGHSARKVVESRFSMEAMAAAYASVYDQLLCRTARG